jgi:N-acetylglucosaminyldiphosphoundecaprenol N-acetyl-beta-D-mannosaminyltransferase
VAKGDLSLIGPRAVSPGQVSASDRAAWRRFSVRPGLVCLWWIRQRANIAYGSESEVDSEYLDSQSLLGDLAIALRAIPAAFYGDAFNGTGLAMAHDRIHLLEIPIDNLTMEEAVDLILVRARGTVPAQLCFVNADCINIARRDSDYKRLLQTASIVLADGIGVKLAGRILNNNVRQNVNGTDLFPVLCRALEGQNAGQNAGIYLLGGKPGVVEEVVAWIRKNYPRVTVKGHRHGYFSVADESAVLGAIRDSGAEILLVAFGAPKQEKWIRGHLEETGARIAIGVGGLFDFYSGRVTRAPVWVREIGMEWLYRFVQEPRRMWRRYFVGNFVFLCRVLSRRFLAGAAE